MRFDDTHAVTCFVTSSPFPRGHILTQHEAYTRSHGGQTARAENQEFSVCPAQPVIDMAVLRPRAIRSRRRRAVADSKDIREGACRRDETADGMFDCSSSTFGILQSICRRRWLPVLQHPMPPRASPRCSSAARSMLVHSIAFPLESGRNPGRTREAARTNLSDRGGIDASVWRI